MKLDDDVLDHFLGYNDPRISLLVAEVRYLRAQMTVTDDDEKVWTWGYSGKHVHTLAPTTADIELVDIARGLATQCRYSGHTTKPYTVAEHSVIVSLMVDPRFAREALLHDAAEAYIGDLVRPLKYRDCMKAFRDAEARLEAAIFARFEVVPTVESRAAVKAIDDRILVDEVSQVIRGGDTAPVARYGPPLGVKIECLSWQKAEHAFLRRFREVFGDDEKWFPQK